jgi:hypothetical protein
LPFQGALVYLLISYLILAYVVGKIYNTKGKGKAHPLQAMQAQRGLGESRLLVLDIDTIWW